MPTVNAMLAEALPRHLRAPDMKRFLIAISVVLGCFALLIAGAILVLYTTDWNEFRDEVATRAGSTLGREVEIRGELDVAPSLTPQIRAENVVFGNADWASRPEMVRVRELYVEFKVLPLLIGRTEVDRIRLVEPDILLETSRSRANWRFGAETGSAAALKAAVPEERSEFPVVKEISVEGGRLIYKSTELDEPIEVRFERIDIRAGGIDATVRVDMKGAYLGSRLSLEAELGSAAQLRDESQPYPVDLRMTIGKTKLAFKGNLHSPLDFKGIEGHMTLEGENLDELYRILDMPLPESPAYRLTGNLDHHGEEWHLRQFNGTLGNSDLSGDVTVLVGRDQPKITADVVSDAIEIEDIEGFWAAKKPEKERAQEPPAGDTLIPDRSFSLSKLRTMDVELRFRGRSVKFSGPLLDGLGAILELNHGLLTLKPLDVGLAEGRVVADLRLDGRSEVPELEGDVRIRGVRLQSLLEVFGLDARSAGSLRGHARVKSRGASLHRIAAALDGEILLVMEGGRISNMLLELLALDLQEAFGQWISGDRSLIEIGCLLAPSRIRSGRVVAAPWILDTSDALVTIRGALDLESERISFELEPHPKDFSLFNTLTSITVEGDLATRTTSVDELDAAAKLVLKTVMAPLMPLLSGEIEERAQSARPCTRLVNQARRGEE